MIGFGFPSRRSSTILLRLFVLLCLSPACLLAQVNFRKPDFDTGPGPTSVAVADFNHDGRPDIVTGNEGGTTISVLLNNGNGTFGPRTDYPAGKNPVSVVTADFNHDGIPDVAAANLNDNTISVFLGNGDGTLRAAGTLATGSLPVALATGDFNKDGKADLAVFNQFDSTVSVFISNGDGTFTRSPDVPVVPAFGGEISFATIAVADFNRDGSLDLAVAAGNSGDVTILLGAGDGTFHAGTPVHVLGNPGDPVEVGRVVAADFNQDGNIDLAVEFFDCRTRGCSSGGMVFAGHGDGTFDQGHNLSVNGGTDPMVAVDLNGDHVPDIVTSTDILITNPATIFTSIAQPVFTPVTGRHPLGMAVGDFDGDGKPDIVTANADDNTVSVLYSNGNGTLRQILRQSLPFVANQMVAGDFNRDGAQDIVVGQQFSKGVEFFAGNGDGTFKTSSELAPDMQALQLAVADLNGDSVLDLVIAGFKFDSSGAESLTIRVLLGKGDGTFRAPIDFAGRVSTVDSLRIADVNHDGKPDIVTISSDTSSNDALNVFLGNGDGTFQPVIKTSIGFASSGIAVGDFNHDGNTDVAVGFTNIGSSSVTISLGNGDGTFHSGQTMFMSGGVTSIDAADFNHDGIVDLAVGHGRSVAILVGNGDGTFTQKADMAAFSVPGKVLATDLNGDGRPDIVVSNEWLSIFVGNGDGTFQQRQDLAVGGAGSMAVADFNSDGKPDVALLNGGLTLSAVAMLLSGNAPPVGPPTRDFAFTFNNSSATVQAGKSAGFTASITAQGTFSDAVTFACSGLPQGAACNFSPASVTPGAQGATTTLTITTTARSSSALAPQGKPAMAAFAAPIFAIVIAGLFSRRKLRMLALLTLLVGALVLVGCGGVSSSGGGTGGNGGGSGGGGGGGGGGNGGGTPAGTSTVVVTATSGGSPAIVHTQPITLTVQ